MTKPITLFSWGYKGWGNSTGQLIEAVDAIEKSRGFEPPMFVDIRIRRTVRAIGFRGPAFEKLLGERHVWMRSLGNKRIVSGIGKQFQITEPESVNKLLDLAQKAAKQRQRIIFFCSCPYPKCDGKDACHRTVVAKLLLAAAKKRKVPVRVVEWPGDDRPRKRMELKENEFQAVRKCACFIPVGSDCRPESLTGPPWGTVMTFKCGGETLHRIVGPMIWRKQKGKRRWQLPVLEPDADPAATLSEYEKLARKSISAFGLTARASLPTGM